MTPSLPTRAYAGDAGPRPRRLRAARARPRASARSSARGSRSRSPTGHAGLVTPRSGLAAEHGITIVNTPGLVDSGYRGELRVILHNTDGAGRVRGRAGDADRPARRRRRPGVGAARGATSCRRASAARAASARPGGTERRVEPRIRVSALLRWRDRILLCRHEKPGQEYWLLPGGGVNSGESLRRRAAPRARRGGRDRRRVPFEGPIAIVDSIAPVRSFASAKHVVHIIFSGDLGGRSLEAVTSADAAVRGHRLFGAGRARRDRAAPADPALSGPLAARRPDRVPRAALGA